MAYNWRAAYKTATPDASFSQQSFIKEYNLKHSEFILIYHIY